MRNIHRLLTTASLLAAVALTACQDRSTLNLPAVQAPAAQLPDWKRAPRLQTPDRLRTVVADFEGEDDLKDWKVRETAPPTRFERSDEHVAHGEAAALLATPSVLGQEQKWPAAILSNLPVSDFSGYEQIRFEAYNPGDVAVPLGIWIDGPEVPLAWFRLLTVQPGWQSFELDLGGYILEHPVTELHFFQNIPPVPYTVAIDHVRLYSRDLSEPAGQLARGKAYLEAAAEKISADSSRAVEIETLRQEAAALQDELATVCAADGAISPGAWLRGFEDFQARFEPFREDLAAELYRRSFPAGSPGYARASALEKPLRDAGFADTLGRVGGELVLAAAAGEVEAAQLCLRSDEALSGVRAVTGPLTGDETTDGAVLPASAVQLSLVGYVRTRTPAYPVEHVGLWPDALLEAETPFDLPAGSWQPLWVEIDVPAYAPAGVYRGEVTVTAGDTTLAVPLVVQVFRSGRAAVEPGLCGIDPAAIEAVYGDRAAEANKRCEAMLADAGLSACELYRRTPATVEQVRAARESGKKSYCLLYVPTPADAAYTAEELDTLCDTIQQAADALEQAGLLDGAFVYGFENAGIEHRPAMISAFERIAEAVPQVKIYCGARDQTCGGETPLAELVDVWLLETALADRAPAGATVLARLGRGPQAPQPLPFIETPAVELRLAAGAAAFNRNAGGVAYFDATHWRNKQRTDHGSYVAFTPAWFVRPLDGRPILDVEGAGWGEYSGSGILLWPMRSSPVGSIRLAALRDGLEDRALLERLRAMRQKLNAGEVDFSDAQMAQWLAAAEAVEAEIREIAPGFTERIDCAVSLEHARLRMLRLVHAARDQLRSK